MDKVSSKQQIKKTMKKVFLLAVILSGMLAACNQKDNQTKSEDNMQKLELTQEWDKVFPLSDKVNHRKVTFETQYGLTLAADLYEPKDAQGKLAAIAVSGPFGACKEAVERTVCDAHGRTRFCNFGLRPLLHR